MPKMYVPDAAARNAAKIDHQTTAWLLAKQSAEAIAEEESKLKADAMYHVAVQDSRAGDSIDIENVSEENLAGEVSCGAFERQEAAYEKAERKARQKAQAKLESALLSEHQLTRLTAILRISIPNVLRHPDSDKEYAWALAFQAEADKQIGRSKFAERHAAEQGTSKSSVERQVREGRRLWASLLQTALNLKIDPDTAIEYLSTLPRIMQLRVAAEAELQRAVWEVGEEVDRYKKAKRLSNGILNKLPACKIVDKDTRLRLTALTEAQQKKEVAEMRHAEKLKLREAADRDNRRDTKFAALSTSAGSLLVKMYASATAIDREYFLEVMGLLAPATTLES